jgi:hypothetical protein
MQWSVTTPPSATALTWQQLKAHIHPASTSEQPYIMDLLAGATAYAETMLQCCLLPQTLTAIFDAQDVGYPCNCNRDFRQRLQLPRGPIIGTVTSVTDTNGNTVAFKRHTAGNADYIEPTTAINGSIAPITVVYQAGFASIPSDILSAIRVHVATLYMVRETITNLAANPVHKIDDFYRFRGRGSLVA